MESHSTRISQTICASKKIKGRTRGPPQPLQDAIPTGRCNALPIRQDGREQHPAQRDDSPGNQGIDEHRDQCRNLEHASSQSLVIEYAVKGHDKNVTQIVQERNKVIAFVCPQQAEKQAQPQNNFQYAQHKVGHSGDPVTRIGTTLVLILKNIDPLLYPVTSRINIVFTLALTRANGIIIHLSIISTIGNCELLIARHTWIGRSTHFFLLTIYCNVINLEKDIFL